MTAFAYLYDDTGNCASQNVQVPRTCDIENTAQITGFFLST